MRVAILNREPSAYPGGDLTAIMELRRELARLNVETETLHGQWTPADLRDFDLVHIFHCNFPWSWFNVLQVWRAGKKYVVTPVFYPTPDLGMDYGEIGEMLDAAQVVMPFSHTEMWEIAVAVGTRETRFKTIVIPNGTNVVFHADEQSFRQGIMTAAARGGDKLNGLVAELASELKIPCSEYTDMPYDEMPTVYPRYRVFVNASGSERMSLTIGEALCAGCRVLATRYNRGNEWYGDGLRIIDPNDRAGLKTAIKNAYWSTDWDYSPNAKARTLTWANTAALTKNAYETALR